MSDVYAVRNRDDRVRAASTSGGVFFPLCASIVGRGGTVYGACFDSEMRVVHRGATTLPECRKFSGSKYVQSDMSGCMPAIRDELRGGRTVLFSGTPCQVAGLQAYLAVSGVRGDLLTVEVICHGVPSPGVWRDHLRLVEAHSHARVRDYRFRDKALGWHQSRQCAVTDGGEVADRTVAAFADVFDFNYALRPSCHECPYAQPTRYADLTIGDYWQVEAYHPELDDDRGVSIVVVNTDLGRLELDAVGDGLERVKLSPEEFDAPNLRRPTPPSPRRQAFWRAYRRLGYEGAIRRYTEYGFIRRNARRLRRAIRAWLR